MRRKFLFTVQLVQLAKIFVARLASQAISKVFYYLKKSLFKVKLLCQKKQLSLQK